jgi:hypothetical protein
VAWSNNNSPETGITGTGTLVILEFTALAQGTSPLTIANEILQDSTGAQISDTTTGASVTVTGGGPVPTPEPSSLLLLGASFGLLAAIGALRRI